MVSEFPQRVGDRMHGQAHFRVQLHRSGGERITKGKSDFQFSGVASHRVADGDRCRLVEIAVVVAGSDVEQQCRVGDGASERAVDRQAVEGFGVGPGGDAPALRFDYSNPQTPI